MASGGAFHWAYPHATQQAFLEAHELAFAWFGGVFRVLRYDKPEKCGEEDSARPSAGRDHAVHHLSLALGLRIRVLHAGRGPREGRRGGRRRPVPAQLSDPVPKVHDLDGLNQLLADGLLEEQGRVIAGRSQTIGAAMIAEREHLLPLASEGFDLAALHFPHINASGCAKVLTNFYSAPLPVGTAVDAKVYSATVEIWYQGRRVASHERCYERHQKVLELDHYLDVLLKKPGALPGSTALEQCRAQGAGRPASTGSGELPESAMADRPGRGS